MYEFAKFHTFSFKLHFRESLCILTQYALKWHSADLPIVQLYENSVMGVTSENLKNTKSIKYFLCWMIFFKAKDSIHLLHNCHVFLRAKAHICEYILWKEGWIASTVVSTINLDFHKAFVSWKIIWLLHKRC